MLLWTQKSLPKFSYFIPYCLRTLEVCVSILVENIIYAYFLCMRDTRVTYLINLLRVHNHIVCPAPSFFSVTALCLKDMMREYVRRSEYHPDMEKLRGVLSRVTDEQKLNILQQTKSERHRTALHEAADRDDAEMITTILSSLKSSNRLKPQMMSDRRMLTPLHTAAQKGHTESVKAILGSLTADQQMQLLTEEDGDYKTPVEMASGETADVLSEYKNKAKEKADPGEFIPLNSHVMSCHVMYILD